MKQSATIIAAMLAAPLTLSSAFAEEAPATQAPATQAPATQAAESSTEGAAAEGTAKENVVVEEEKEEDKKAWRIAASLNTSVGQGTFVDIDNNSEFADELGPADEAFDRWSLSFSLTPSYTIADVVTVSTSLAFVQWLTTGGGVEEPGEFRFQDIGLSADWVGYEYKPANLSFGAGLGLTFPTSELSQTSSLYVATGISGNVGWTLFDKLSLGYGLSIGKDFHEFTSPVIDDEIAGADNVIWRAGGSERLSDGLTAIDGVNTEWSISNSFSAGFPIVGKLRMGISYSLTTFWAYDVFEEDEFTDPLADPGRGVGQSTSGSISLSYPVHKYLSLSLATRTSVQPKTADNRTFNFPFWNFDGAAANSSQIRFGLSSSY